MKSTAKLLAILLVLAMMFTLVACDNTKEPEETTGNTENSDTPKVDSNTKEPENTTKPDENTTKPDDGTKEPEGTTEPETEEKTLYKAPVGNKIDDGTMIFYQDFDLLPNTTGNDAVLALLRQDGHKWVWDDLENPLYPEKGDFLGFSPFAEKTGSLLSIVDGKLQINGYKDADGNAISKKNDNYLVIDTEDFFWELENNDYTIQYDVCVTDSADNQRYLNIVWNYMSEYYYSFHFRVCGTANLQTHYSSSWKTIDQYEEGEDLFAASKDKVSEGTGTSVINKLCGRVYENKNDDYHAKDIEFSIRIQVSQENGPTIWMRILNGDGVTPNEDWVKVSKYSDKAKDADSWRAHNYTNQSKAQLSEFFGGYTGGIALKVGGKVDGTFDNIAIWTGLGDMPSDTTVSYTPEPRPEVTTEKVTVIKGKEDIVTGN